jgi:phage terminase large subunit-like protein
MNHVRTKSDEVALTQGYYFDADLAEKKIGKMESLFKVKLLTWQRELLWLYYGWRNAQGGYRFSELVCSIAKKNGKSFLIAVLIGDKIFELKDGKIFSIAANAKQARECILDPIITMFRNSPKIKAHMKPRTGKLKCFSNQFRREITNEFNHTRYWALAKGVGSNDGLIPDMVVIDEPHQQDNSQIDIMDNSTANNPNALKVYISTAGSGDKTHRWFQKYTYAKAVLKGEVIDVHLLPVIYEAAEGEYTVDQLYSEELLRQANPIYVDCPDKLEKAKQEILQAKANRNDSNWKRYRLNMWCAVDGEVYVLPEAYEACKVPALPEIELGGLDCYAGWDRAGVWDFSALALLFRLPDGRVYEKYYAFAVEDRLPTMQEEDAADYGKYITDGELIVVPGDVVMDDWLSDWLKTELKKYHVRKVGADPSWAQHQVESLMGAGFDVLQVQQTNNRLLTPVIEDYQTRVRSKRIIHSENTLFNWMLSCCRKITTAKDCNKIVKMGSNRLGQGGEGHIDCIDAAINALAVLRAQEIQESAYGSGGIVVG